LSSGHVRVWEKTVGENRGDLGDSIHMTSNSLIMGMVQWVPLLNRMTFLLVRYCVIITSLLLRAGLDNQNGTL
jgi:preprotein translocase subunit SecG